MKAIIIDDERHNVNNLNSLLKRHCKEVDVIAVATTFKQGKELLSSTEIDILFLDIELDDGTGFELLGLLEGYKFQVIFVTGYENYAVKAFRVSASDYIMKPIDIDELKAAVAKVAGKISERHSNDLIENMNLLLKKPLKQKRLELRLMNEVKYVNVTDIMAMEASHNYTKFHIKDMADQLVTKPMAEFERQVKDDGFFRPHNKWVVNSWYVASLHTEANTFLKLTGGLEVPVSRENKEWVKKYLLQP